MTAADSQHVETLIIGAGFSGIGLAIRLQQQGCNDFLVLEKASGLGGCWRDNTYPGAACDVPSNLYSFSFIPNPDWSRRFSSQAEILAYLQRCANDYQLDQHIRFQQPVESARFDSETGLWHVNTADRHYTTRFLVSACGQLSRPAYPTIDGLDNFTGDCFHSAEWNHDVDFTNKNVAIIGTGASVVQLAPEVARQAKSLTIFQRSAPYILPKRDRAYRNWEKALNNRFPWVQRLRRVAIYSQHESRAIILGPLQFLLGLYALRSRLFMRKTVKAPDMRRQLTPDYTIGCKRILLTSNYYETLVRDNVQLDTSGISSIGKQHLTTNDGTVHAADVLIYGTGFKANDFLVPMEITGLGGLKLHAAWQQGAEAFKGISVSGFPNLLLCYGPNTNLGHNSVIHMIESQIRYVLHYMAAHRQHDFLYLDIKQSAQQDYNQKLQHHLSSSVWNTGGCQSWYLTRTGKNTNNWPGMASGYSLMTKTFTLSDYQQQPAS